MTASPSFRLAFATSSHLPQVHPDDLGLSAALKALGIEATACIWNDPAVDWRSFDAVLMRTTWDYFKLYPEFLRWLDKLDRLCVTTINDSALLRWNCDKRYLLELTERGVDIIPTQIVAHERMGEVLRATGEREVVVKPTVSGAAWNTLRGWASDPGFLDQVSGLPGSLTYMLQPFMPEIVSEGEWALMFFEGRYSHAVIKRPAKGDYRVQNDWGGRAELAQPDPSVCKAAERVLAAAAAVGHRNQAYARVDGVVSGGKLLLMELEMTEPSLHFGAHPPAAELFASNLAARLRALSQTT